MTTLYWAYDRVRQRVFPVKLLEILDSGHNLVECALTGLIFLCDELLEEVGEFRKYMYNVPSNFEPFLQDKYAVDYGLISRYQQGLTYSQVGSLIVSMNSSNEGIHDNIEKYDINLDSSPLSLLCRNVHEDVTCSHINQMLIFMGSSRYGTYHDFRHCVKYFNHNIISKEEEFKSKIELAIDLVDMLGSHSVNGEFTKRYSMNMSYQMFFKNKTSSSNQISEMKSLSCGILCNNFDLFHVTKRNNNSNYIVLDGVLGTSNVIQYKRQDFRYLQNHKETTTLQTQSRYFVKLVKGCQQLGLTNSDITLSKDIMKAVIFLGNIDFEENKVDPTKITPKPDPTPALNDTESTVQEETEIEKPPLLVKISSSETSALALKSAATIFGVSVEQLEECLCKNVPSCEVAVFKRDCTAQRLYTKIVQKLTSEISSKLCVNEEEMELYSKSSGEIKLSVIPSLGNSSSSGSSESSEMFSNNDFGLWALFLQMLSIKLSIEFFASHSQNDNLLVQTEGLIKDNTVTVSESISFCRSCEVYNLLASPDNGIFSLMENVDAKTFNDSMLKALTNCETDDSKKTENLMKYVTITDGNQNAFVINHSDIEISYSFREIEHDLNSMKFDAINSLTDCCRTNLAKYLRVTNISELCPFVGDNLSLSTAKYATKMADALIGEKCVTKMILALDVSPNKSDNVDGNFVSNQLAQFSICEFANCWNNPYRWNRKHKDFIHSFTSLGRCTFADLPDSNDYDKCSALITILASRFPDRKLYLGLISVFADPSNGKFLEEKLSQLHQSSSKIIFKAIRQMSAYLKVSRRGILKAKLQELLNIAEGYSVDDSTSSFQSSIQETIEKCRLCNFDAPIVREAKTFNDHITKLLDIQNRMKEVISLPKLQKTVKEALNVYQKRKKLLEDIRAVEIRSVEEDAYLELETVVNRDGLALQQYMSLRECNKSCNEIKLRSEILEAQKAEYPVYSKFVFALVEHSNHFIHMLKQEHNAVVSSISTLQACKESDHHNHSDSTPLNFITSLDQLKILIKYKSDAVIPTVKQIDITRATSFREILLSLTKASQQKIYDSSAKEYIRSIERNLSNLYLKLNVMEGPLYDAYDVCLRDIRSTLEQICEHLIDKKDIESFIEALKQVLSSTADSFLNDCTTLSGTYNRIQNVPLSPVLTRLRSLAGIFIEIKEILPHSHHQVVLITQSDEFNNDEWQQKFKDWEESCEIEIKQRIKWSRPSSCIELVSLLKDSKPSSSIDFLSIEESAIASLRELRSDAFTQLIYRICAGCCPEEKEASIFHVLPSHLLKKLDSTKMILDCLIEKYSTETSSLKNYLDIFYKYYNYVHFSNKFGVVFIIHELKNDDIAWSLIVNNTIESSSQLELTFQTFLRKNVEEYMKGLFFSDSNHNVESSVDSSSSDNLEFMLTNFPIVEEIIEKISGQSWLSDDLVSLIKCYELLLIAKKTIVHKDDAKAREALKALKYETTRADITKFYQSEIARMYQTCNLNNIATTFDKVFAYTDLISCVTISENCEFMVSIDIDIVKELQTSLNLAAEYIVINSNDNFVVPETFKQQVQFMGMIRNIFESIECRNWILTIENVTATEKFSKDLTIIREKSALNLETLKHTVEDIICITDIRHVFAQEGAYKHISGTLLRSSISNDKLLEVVSSHDSRVEIGVSAQNHIKLGKYLIELRRKAISGEWKEVLQQCKNATNEVGLGMIAFQFAEPEFEKYSLEAINRIFIKGLTNATMKEIIIGEPGDINAESVQTGTLTSAVAKARDLLDNGSISIFSKAIFKKCEFLLNTRVNIRNSNWFSCSNNLNGVLKAMDLFKKILNGKLAIGDETALEALSSTSSSAGQSRSSLLRGSVRVDLSDRNSIVGREQRASAPDSKSDTALSDATDHGIEDIIILLDQEFHEFFNKAKEEFDLLCTAYGLHKCETDMINAISRNGVLVDPLGNVDLRNTRTDDLEKVLVAKDHLEKHVTQLPSNLVDLCRICSITLEMRKAFINDDDLYDGPVPRYLEELAMGETAKMPDPWRNEIRAMQIGLEHQRMYKKLSAALDVGKLQLSEAGEPLLASVSSEGLEDLSISKSSSSMRSDKLSKLFLTVDSMVELRKMVETDIDWNVISSAAGNVLVEIEKKNLSPLVTKEVENFITASQDILLRIDLEESLHFGFATGVPGSLDISTLNVSAVTKALRKANSKKSITSKKTQRAVYVAENIRKLRITLIEASNKSGGLTLNADWSEISKISERISEIRHQHSHDEVWRTCREELLLYENEAQIFKIKRLLSESLDLMEETYQKKNTVDVGDQALYRKRTKLLSSSKKPLTCDDLIEIEKLPTFGNPILEDLVASCNNMKLIRQAVIDQRFEEIIKMSQDEEFMTQLVLFRPASREMKAALDEAHNHEVAIRLEAALKHKTVHLTKEIDYARLEKEVDSASKAQITDVSIGKLYEIAQHVLGLRRGQVKKESNAVGEHLTWLSNHENLCPPGVREEIRVSKIAHQNDLVFSAITKALQTGKANANAEYSWDSLQVDTTELNMALHQAQQLTQADVRVRKIQETAELIYILRCAQKSSDHKGIKRALGILSKRETIDPVVLEEVAIARSESDNRSAVSTLTDGLMSFELTPLQLIQLALNEIPRFDEITTTITSTDDKFPEGSNKESITDCVDDATLESSLELARSFGIFTRNTRKLFRTAGFVLKLRKAIKMNDWEGVEQRLSEGEESSLLGETFDSLADKEIQTICLQVELRGAIKELLNSLTTGSASCSNGVVDVTKISFSEILNFMDSAERAILGLNGVSTKSLKKKSSGFSRALEDIVMDGSNPCLSKLRLLLTSAKLISDTRRYIHNGDLKSAGSLAEDSLTKNLHHVVKYEIHLYASEINRALTRLSLTSELQNEIRSGSIKKLRTALGNATSHMRADLGFVRILEAAKRAIHTYVDIQNKLGEVIKDYDPDAIETIIERAQAFEVDPALLNAATKRILDLKNFEQMHSDFLRSGGGIITSRDTLEEMQKMAEECSLKLHPSALLANIFLRMEKLSLIPSLIVRSIKHDNAITASSITMQLRRNLFKVSHLKEHFSIENFPQFRNSSTFVASIGNSSSELKQHMLKHSYVSIPTSLTVLSAGFAALAVWIFSQCIKGIEGLTNPNVNKHLIRMILVGRTSPVIRDEILAQHIKMIRSNPMQDSTRRLWLSLSACLKYFPPSREFESYLECFLIMEIEESNLNTTLAKSCIEHLHQSVFRYGYSVKISEPLDDDLSEIFAYKDNIDLDNSDEDTEINDKMEENDETENFLDVNEMEMRGTRENWRRRFFTFSGGSDEMLRDEFRESLFSTNWDSKDKEVLLLLVSGMWPSRRRSIIRSFYSDDYVFQGMTQQETDKSIRRRDILSHCVGPPTDNPSNDNEAVDLFWKNIVNRLSDEDSGGNEVSLNWEIYRDIIMEGMGWLANRGRNVLNERTAQRQAEKSAMHARNKTKSVDTTSTL